MVGKFFWSKPPKGTPLSEQLNSGSRNTLSSPPTASFGIAAFGRVAGPRKDPVNMRQVAMSRHLRRPTATQSLHWEAAQ